MNHPNEKEERREVRKYNPAVDQRFSKRSPMVVGRMRERERESKIRTA